MSGFNNRHWPGKLTAAPKMDQLRVYDPAHPGAVELLGCHPSLSDEEALRAFGVARHCRVERVRPPDPPRVIQADARNEYGVLFERGGYVVAWWDADGNSDAVDMGPASTIPLFPDDPYPVFDSLDAALAVIARLSP